MKELEAACLMKCPAKEKVVCPITKEEGQSDAEYEAACAALENSSKAAATVAATAAKSDDVTFSNEEEEGDEEATW